MSTTERPKAHVDKPDEGDLQLAIHALSGIFWALNMLVVDGAPAYIAHERDRENGIASLILAGKLLVKDLTERF